MSIGYFDYMIFIVLMILNIVFWKKSFASCSAYGVVVLLFGLILPVVSSFIDIRMSTSGKTMVDNFELLHNYLKFPLYWGVGLLQLLVWRFK